MRKALRSATIVAGSVALITTASPMAAQAHTKNEFEWCWKAPAVLSQLQATLVADGPAFRKRTLTGPASCVTMHVPAGQYEVTIDNGTELRRALRDFNNTNGINSLCGPAPANSDWHFVINAQVKRQGQTYTAHRIVDINFNNGGFNDQQKVEQFSTGVRQHRLTRINVFTQCVAHQF
jgi:hypothetical protein